MQTQKLKTVVTLGGTVDSSFNSMGTAFSQSMKEASDNVRTLEGEQRQLSRTMRSAKKAAEDLAKVEAEQTDTSNAMAALEEQRAQAKRNINAQRQAIKRLDEQQQEASDNESGDLSEIKEKRDSLEKSLESEIKDRDRLSREIKKTAKAQKDYTQKAEKLKGAIKDVDELESSYNKLGAEISEAKRQSEAFDKAQGLGKTLKGTAKAGAAATAVIIGSGGALAGLITVTNQATAEQVGLAQSYDMSIERFKAWSGVAKQAGLDGENVGDLIEELSNKFGEFKALGKQSTVSDVFGALGVDSSMMDGMAAAEQFEFIMKRLEKVQDKQVAASLADQLFGGEANKIVTYTRNTGKSIDDLLSKQTKLNQLTKAGASGAALYGNAYKDLNTVVSTAWQEISGIVGGEMAPEMDQLGASISEFVRANKTDIVDTLKAVIDGVGWAATTIFSLGHAVNDVVQAIGGWKAVGAAVAGLMAGKMVVGVGGVITTVFSMTKTLGLAKTAMMGLNLVMAANPLGLVAVAIGALVTGGILLYQNWDKVKEWFGGFFDWFKTEFPNAFSVVKTIFDWSPVGIIINNWKPVTEFFAGLWDGIGNIFTSRIAKIKTVMDTVGGWIGKLKFWEDDSTPEVSVNATKTSAITASTDRDRDLTGGRRGRGAAAVRNATKASQGAIIQQSVGDIHVTAAPGQSVQDVAQAIQDKLSDQQSSALYDLPSFG
jgi:predicted  nucleic acid-binding Zn-ribbon protein